ncbi:flagellar type III secretion system pore protein FliP [Massilia endophytica]|nr:flagellar type III secretion system pore protein FliP [Massilia endophytica]
MGALAAGQCLAGPAALAPLPGLDIRFVGAAGQPAELSGSLKVLLGLTVLSLLPALLVSMTSFIRISIVLSMLRHAFGTQETPPNMVLISLALFLTLFSMKPVLHDAHQLALQPYLDGKLAAAPALAAGVKPLREFMVRQTREQDLALMAELSRRPEPASMEEVDMLVLIPAFMLSELRAAFQIGFVLFLPFLLIDLVVSTLLMSLGMMMVPPATISLPAKLLMFVLIDGWNLVARALLGSFQ